MISSNRTFRSAAVVGGCLLLTIALAWIFFPPRQPQAAEKIVRESWRLMQEVGQYDFATTVEQATFPAPALANVGQSSTKEVYQISGLADLHNDTLEIRLFQNQGSLLDQTNGVEIRVADNKASGRPIGSTEWQPLENNSSASYTFGSNGSTFLTAARNVQAQASQTLELPNRDGGVTAVSVTRYSFDVDPNEYAVLMRDQMVAELQRSGKLPLGMQLSVSDQYRAMVSSGEVWISDEGLPVRMSVTMKMPPEKTGEHVEATITTDYFNHRSGNLLAARPLPYQIAGALGLPTTPKAMGELTLQFSLLAGCALLLVLMAAFSNKKFIYAGVAGLVILSMLVTPIWNGEKTAVFAKDIQAQNASIEAEQQAARQEREAYAAAYSSDWDAHANPLDRIETDAAASEPAAAGAVEQPVVFNSLFDEIETAQTAGESGEADVDSDGDGLTDAFESESDISVLNPNDPDTDDDGLDDNIELLLNLFPGEKDTDSDGIWDNDEIRPFYAGDKDWYLNAEERDTDMDGQLDGAECSERSNGTAGICRDTDSDHIPDAFDPDDDNDGIPTVYDESPYVLSSQVYSSASPLKLSIDGVEVGKSTYINYQFIPTNEKHLTYTLSVLDWPTKDTDGQIQRVSDTVFANNMTSGQVAQDPRSQFGDMRLIPMVEIKMPGSSIPFPVSDTVVIDFSITGLSGSLEFKADTTSSTWVKLTQKSTEQPISKVIEIGEGTCEEFESVTALDLHSVSDTAAANLSLGDLVDGNHVLAFFDAGSTDYLCSTIPAVAHGNSELTVIDSTTLQAYGGAVRDDGEGSLLVYTPLSLVYDETGGRPVAFSTRIPYSNEL
ncbi:MAG TPA: hypothetical protein VFF68_11595, partial [Anaerolineaceae bacterium]|nr:hypothetical protein [Anaerolineaceae bacterium]